MFANHRIFRSGLFAIPISLIAILLTASLVSAHVKQAVGNYTIFVGFKNEPALVEQPNGVDLLVRNGASEDAAPVTGLTGLKADVKFGGQSTTVDLEEVDGSPGEYVGSFIPTAQGPYTFRVYGSIDGTPFDQSFTSGPQTFSEVQSASQLQFPSQVPPVASVAQQASNASNAASSAKTFGIVGIVVGVLGLIAGIGGMVMARGARASGASGAPEVSDDATGSPLRS